jgi:hypothetical protein
MLTVVMPLVPPSGGINNYPSFFVQVQKGGREVGESGQDFTEAIVATHR